ncbi:MAG: metallopeptidase family protein [Minisyncoccia bacterium]
MIPRGDFEQIVIDEVEKIPLHFRNKIKNVVFVVEDEVSIGVRGENNLTKEQDLLGLYKGIPLTARGDSYGVGMTLPDVITIYQGPTERSASGDTLSISSIVRETVFHEVAHYLGMNEGEVATWEAKQDQHQEF